MKKFVIIIVLFGFAPLAFSETCIYTNLSKQFNIETTFERINDQDNDVIITIKDKILNKTKQIIEYGSFFLFYDVFKNCESVKSYQTHVNDDLKDIDGDFGDLIVADFNFDGYDDFAAKNDSGGTAGAHYNFYIQDADGKFYLNKVLSKEMSFFPRQINNKNKTLVISVVTGVCSISESVYSYNDNSKVFFEKSHRDILCEELLGK